jgi:CBS domain-containing protein
MSAGALCVRSVHVASPGESVLEAAQRMREAGVGTLVVLDDKRRPVGMLTDRDVAVRVVAERRDPGATKVAEAMTSPVQAVHESTPIEDAVARMEGAAIRRVAVTDADGRLVGILALDDVLELIAEEVTRIGRLVARRAPRRG